MKRIFVPLQLGFILLFLLQINCGGGTQSVESTAINETPVTQTETISTEASSSNDSPTISPTPAPTKTATPTPAPTKTATPTPTPTQIPNRTIVNDFGFDLSIDGEIDIQKSGLSTDDPTSEEGIIYFEYGGANAILMWFIDANSQIDAVLVDNYTSLTTSQPDLTFSPFNEGSTLVSSVEAQFLAFTTTDLSAANGAGIIGSWRCNTETVYSLTATGSDLTVVQLRFKRLLDGFTCRS